MDSAYYSKLELCGGLVMVFFFEVPPLAGDALLTMLHLLPKNLLQTIDRFEISCLGAPVSLLEKPRNCIGVRSGLYGRCSNEVPPIHFFQAKHRIQFRPQWSKLDSAALG
jgi:hypothetical protein